ncbi:sugar phosphate isomerase/epimerase family protein [Tichowtungia aerotolerans]|uniref:TIM barrel protein n=1 Tax=Tichowtungia aerotolerans TaxID=2697043 RepID=A0A6P1M9V2_9BACT|nr:TIM barrel protein [Tichowtungia aerotolerans]QHI70611.1 TIM barrel protein [Tichowtungia aerotolerans]
MKTGICSITFRPMNVGQVADLVKTAGLDAIEWGGDVHVRPGDLTAARVARRTTVDAGLEVSSYGSYFRVLDKEGRAEAFQPVLDSTLALETNTVRIWAGYSASAEVSEDVRSRFAEQAQRVAEMAAASGVNIGFEFHDHSLTDTNESAAKLLQEIDAPNVYLYWQPMYQGPDMDYRMAGLHDLKDRILNFHVFHWEYDGSKELWIDAVDRRPLSEGQAEWKQYFSVELPPRERYALLEFVRDDDPKRFLEDAETLKAWLEGTVK